MLRAMRSLFNQTDFSVVVKNRAPPPKSWREIMAMGDISSRPEQPDRAFLGIL
jgi:hypothetical protein